MREIGWYLSAEVGHYWFGTTNLVPGVFNPAIKLPDYTTWNAGIAFTHSVATLDLRGYGTDLSKANCNILTGDPNARLIGGVGQSNWCGTTVIAALKFDLTYLANVKK